MKKGGRIWSLAWRLAVAVTLLTWIFHSIFLLEGRRASEQSGQIWNDLPRSEQWQIGWSRGPGQLWETLCRVELTALLLSLLFMGATILIGLLRWRMVLRVQGLNLSLGRTAEISLVAHFFNSFLLGSTGGDLLKAYYAARETHHKKTEAVVTVLIDRLVGLFSMLLFACLMMIPNLSLLRAHAPLQVLAGLILLMMAGCAVVVMLSFWGGVTRQWPRARDWLRHLPKGDLLERALDASRQFGRVRFFLARMLVMSMALNLFCVLQIMALASGLQVTIAPTVLLVIVPVVVCISALPISLSGLGIRENLYVIMLGVSEIGVEATAALSISLLAYAGSLFWSGLGGLVYLFRRDRDRLSEFSEVQDASDGDS